MSGFPMKLREIGLQPKPKKPCKHRKLTPEMLALFLTEAQKHVDLLSYDELAERSGLSRGTVRGLMAQMIREKRLKEERVRHPICRETHMTHLADSLQDTQSDASR